MKRIVVGLLLIFSVAITYAQKAFPENAVGVWSGDLKIYSTKGDLKMKIPMELHIDTTQNDSTWKWEIHYLMLESEPDIRKYELKIVNDTNGNYVIDEKNGIKLSGKLFGNVFVSRFSVQNNLLLIKYRFLKDTLFMEVIAGKENEKEKTGDVPEKEIPIVYNYALTAYQIAILKRKE